LLPQPAHGIFSRCLEAVMTRFTLLALAALGLAACSPPAAQKPPVAPPAADSQAEVLRDGFEIASTQCGVCHAVTAEAAESPRPDAPPFRTLLSRYHADVLEDDLINAIHLGHEDMPTFAFNPQGADALIAYLKSIQQPAAPQ
jgi:mono/diheme cytochrome c family protein